MATNTRTAPEGVVDSAVTTVLAQIQALNAMSSQYRYELTQALAGLKGIEIAQVQRPELFRIPDTPVPSLNLSQAPEYSNVPLNPPSMPSMHEVESLLTDLSLDDLQIPAVPEQPALQMPDLPAIQGFEAPVAPNIDHNIEMPDTPDLQMPDMPDMLKIEIPQFSFPELPDFNGVPPNLNSISVPNVFIDWVEPEYHSEILEDLESSVRLWMKGGTGLPAEIQDALFARTRTRQSRETERAIQESLQEWSSRGFSLPQGAMAQSIASIRENGQLQSADLNRDIMIESAKWEIENLRFIIEQGIALEQMTSGLHSNMANHIFESAKFNAESQISVFNAQIALFNSQNDAFKTLGDVYRTKLDGAVAKLTAYKTAVDAQTALGQINEQHVQVYRAKIEAVQSNVDLYKAMIQGASTRAELIKNRFDAYRTEVQAYSEKIGAEKIKVDIYEAQTKAESAKIGMHEANARAYASTVQAVQAKAEVKSNQIRLRMEGVKTWIAKYAADMDGYKAGLQARLSEVQSNTANFTAQVEAWRVNANVSIAESEMQSRFADLNTRTNIAYSEMQIKEYEANIQRAVQQAQIALESAKALGQYTAQLAAGAMSATHVSASISGSGSSSVSSSISESKSESHNYTY